MATVLFYDGEVARRRQAELETVGDTFLVVEHEVRHGPFRFDDLVALDGARGGGAAYGHRAREGWRIVFPGSIPQEIAPRLPRVGRYGGIIDRIGLWRASLAFAAISAAIAAIVFTAPQWLAPLIPGSVERRLGETLVGDLGGRVCHTPAGDAALARLVRQLDPAPGDLDVGVANIDMVNAAALPGGKLFVMEGLLQKARSPEELAGVLGHEIGHVRERHVMQALLRQMGLSIFLAGADSNVAGTLGGMLSLSYGRTAEREADAHAISAMRRAAIDPSDTAAFFDRMGGAASSEKGGDSKAFRLERLGGYLSSHPLSAERRDAFLDSRRTGVRYRSPLSPGEWRALRRICIDDPDVAGSGAL